MTAWHVDDDLARRYALGLADLALAASLESHVITCRSCRERLAPNVAAERLTRIWDAVTARLDHPVPTAGETGESRLDAAGPSLGCPPHATAAAPVEVAVKPLGSMTAPTQLVLRALLKDPDRERYGLELSEASGLSTGTLYPILSRLEQAGWVESRWEDPARHESAHRPRRRLYRITPDGAEHARTALADAYRAARNPRIGWTGTPAMEGGQA
jgi:PadR family transcriptional regulator, regulatory protein PadR